MADFDPAKRKLATEVFKLAARASSRAVHRTLNRPPRGKGWVQCANAPGGTMCRPDKVREAIAYFGKAYAILPDIVALYQIALHYEMIGEAQAAKQHFALVKEQAQRESNPAYVQAAELGLVRLE